MDNGDPVFTSNVANFNIQFDGMTILLTGKIQISANVTYHIKIGIEDYVDEFFDSAVFIKSWSSLPGCQCQ